MITITAELLHGTIRANAADPVAGVTDRAMPEWPPSPARLFAALVSGGGTGEHNRIGSDDEELRKIERAEPPLIAASTTADAPASALQERYVVINESPKLAKAKQKKEKLRVQEYPARSAQAVRAGSRSAPRSRYVTYCWPELDLTAKELLSLRRRAARVGYLGGSASPVRLMINAETPRDDREMWLPDDRGTTPIAVPYVGYLGLLDRAFEDFRNGVSPRGAAIRRVKVTYTDQRGVATAPEGPTVVWMSFAESIGYRRVLHVGEALRGAVLSSFENAGFGTPPAVLHGHGVDRGHQHARFLALPNVGHPHARGQILGAAIWLPPGTDAQLVEMVRVAAARIRRLNLKGGRSIPISVRDSAARPWTTHPRRWTQPSRTFASAFPVVHDRFGKVNRANELKVATEWCENAGLPAPVSAFIDQASPFAKVPKLASREVWRDSSAGRYPYSHVRLGFTQPLVGPLAIGRGRSFGLGLLVPLPEQGSDEASAEVVATGDANE